MSERKTYNFYEYVASYYQGRALAYGMVGNVFMQLSCSNLAKYYEQLSKIIDIELPIIGQ